MSWFFDLIFGGKSGGSADDDQYERRSRKDKDKDHELPERIRKLPKDDPERMRFEKGWKERKREQFEGELNYSFSSSPKAASLFGLVILSLILLLGYSLNEAHRKYMAEVYALRATIHSMVRLKGYEPYDPQVYTITTRTEQSNWVPTLEDILAEVSRYRPKLAVTMEDSNAQSGSYLSYIKLHNLPFNQNEALRWTVNEYRSN